jgi:hypothetical protein
LMHYYPPKIKIKKKGTTPFF